MSLRHFLALLLLPAAATADSYVPGSADDPSVREAGYLAADGHYLAASAALYRVAADPANSKSATFYLQPLADSLLAFGIRDHAEEVYQQIAGNGGNDGGKPRDFADVRLKLAELGHQRGADDRALQELAVLRGGLVPARIAAWTDLDARVLLSLGRYQEAADLLSKIDAAQVSPYQLYNLAIALLNTGHSDRGRAALDRLGLTDATGEEMLSLRDKANLVLAYDYLRSQDGGDAIAVFERIRLTGPFSNRALLGLGWAQFARHGRPASHGSAGNGSIGNALAAPQEQDSSPITLPHGAGERQSDLKHALVAWVPLSTRDALDPAVEEGLLAVPYSLQKLGANEQAEALYNRAIDTLDTTQHRLDAALDDVRSGQLFDVLVQNDANDDDGWTWTLAQLPATSSTYYLRNLIAEAPFQAALKDYRDSRLLARNVDAWQAQLAALQKTYGCPAAAIAAPCQAADSAGLARVAVLLQRIAVLRPQIDTSGQAARQNLQTLAIDELQAQKKSAETYALQARMALARIYDSPPAEDSK